METRGQREEKDNFRTSGLKKATADDTDAADFYLIREIRAIRG